MAAADEQKPVKDVLSALPKVGEQWRDKHPGYYISRQHNQVFEGYYPDAEHRYLTIETVKPGDRLGREVQGTLKTGRHFTASLLHFVETWEKVS